MTDQEKRDLVQELLWACDDEQRRLWTDWANNLEGEELEGMVRVVEICTGRVAAGT